MKLLIVENVYMNKGSYGFFDKTLLTSFSILPTLQARQIAAITPEKHQVDLINERYKKIDFNKKYDIVHINYTTSTTPRAYAIADKYRKKDTKVVLSGLHASGIPNEAKKHADSIILGNIEPTWLQILKDYKKGKIQKFYPPISYEESNVKIPPTNVQLPGFNMIGAVQATRGCPYQCHFCPSNNTNNSNYYKRPVEEVISEIKKLPQKIIMFYDDTLTVDPSYTKKLFTGLKKLNKKFLCNGNINVLAEDKEFVKLSKKAGCLAWLVGFESILQKNIKNIEKKTNKTKLYHKAVKNLHRNRIVTIGDFIFGFDHDNQQIFKKTLEFIKKIQIDVADFCILTPFPGTKTYEKLDKENRILTKKWEEYNLKNTVFKPKNMTPEQLNNGVRKMYQNFYSPFNTAKRISKNIKLGIYPFFTTLARNTVATMNSRKLFE
ncbi:MAG: radical SAM protein [Candidatus Thermoplasmatota archaeon]